MLPYMKTILISLNQLSHVFNPSRYSCKIFTCMNYKCIFTCVAKGESRSRSAVTPSVRPKILSLQLLWNYWYNYHETWYVVRTSYVVMHIGRKVWSPHFCGSYVPWNLENTYKWPCHYNSSETTDPFIMKLGMKNIIWCSAYLQEILIPLFLWELCPLELRKYS